MTPAPAAYESRSYGQETCQTIKPMPITNFDEVEFQTEASYS